MVYCDNTFNNLKKHLSIWPLTHFDLKWDIIVAVDACEYGLGACLMHSFPRSTRKAICYASRSLSVAERKYSQIEKEVLALVLAITMFQRNDSSTVGNSFYKLAIVHYCRYLDLKRALLYTQQIVYHSHCSRTIFKLNICEHQSFAYADVL